MPAPNAQVTIAITNFKGGVGKSLLTHLLAAEFAAQGHRAQIFDTDPQQSTTRWYVLSKQRGYKLDDIAVFSASGTLEPDQPSVDKGATLELSSTTLKARLADLPPCDVLLIDVGGYWSEEAGLLFSLCDAILIPVVNEATSATQAIEVGKVLQNIARATGRTIPYRAIFNSVTHINQNSMAMMETLAELKAAKFPIAKPFLTVRDWYARVGAGYGTLYEWQEAIRNDATLRPWQKKRMMQPIEAAIDGVKVINNEVVAMLEQSI
mgnify:CR=1 FL=1